MEETEVQGANLPGCGYAIVTLIILIILAICYILTSDIPRAIEQDLFDGDNSTYKLNGLTEQVRKYPSVDV